MPPECSTPSCTGPAQAKGLCWRCYGRLRRNGSPTASGQHGGRRDEVVAPSEPPDPRPVRRLRFELERSRALDASFALAWSSALALALDSLPKRLRNEWREVLDEHRPVWRAAYFGEMEVKGSWAMSALEAVDDADDFFSYRRSAPRVRTTAVRHDKPSTLEPVTVRWCR